MITITQEQAKAIRRKQADLSLNIEQTAKAIGITRTIKNHQNRHFLTIPCVEKC